MEKKKSQLADEFRAEFTAQKNKIIKDTEELNQAPATELKERITSISVEIQNLKIKLQESTKILPAYTAKARHDDLKALEETLKEREGVLAPRPKFAFKRIVNKPSQKPTAAESDQNAKCEENKLHEAPADNLQARNDPNFLTIQNDTIGVDQMDTERITFEEDKLNKIDVMVRELDNKEICLYGSPSTLHLSNLNNCKLICGPVQTSVFVDNCKNSTLYLCCQQLRTHNSTDLDIYLRVSSRGIIENCTKIRFAPYEWDHPRSLALHEVANIDAKLQRFDAIDDFNWLAFTTPSPNWSLLPEHERKIFPQH